MSSVKNFLRRQVDVSNLTLRTPNQNQSSSEVEQQRPLSEYDNLQVVTTNGDGGNILQSHFPLADIKFRFDDLSATGMSSSMQNSNIPANTPQYENVIDTVQMRNKRESDRRQVNEDQSDGNSLPRPAISEAKSSFFGLNSSTPHKFDQNDDLEQLIEDCANVRITPNEVQYVNLTNDMAVSATSSASGSSSVTATPKSSPARDERLGCSRKNSEGSNRSKSPKFILPEVPTPSQVSNKSVENDKLTIISCIATSFA
jgi:hypothetical protein